MPNGVAGPAGTEDRIAAQRARRRPALLAVSSVRDSVEGRCAVDELMAAVSDALPGVAVSSSAVDVQSVELAPGLAGLAASDRAVAVPLLLSAGYHVYLDLAAALRASPGDARLAAGLGPDDALVQVLASRLALAGLGPGDAVVLAAAGSSDHRAVRDCIETGRRLGLLLGRPVTVGFLSAAVPRLTGAIETVRQLHPGSRVVVSTYLLAPGGFAVAAAESGGSVTSSPLLIPGTVPPRQLVETVVARYRQAVAAEWPS